jgi:hypothetical protein
VKSSHASNPQRFAVPVRGRSSASRPVEVGVDDRNVPLELDLGGEAARANPDHHLWRNGRLWWIAFTVHRGHQQERIRFSLATEDLAEARARRDRILGMVARARDCRISLRFAAKRQSDSHERAGESRRWTRSCSRSAGPQPREEDE